LSYLLIGDLEEVAAYVSIGTKNPVFGKSGHGINKESAVGDGLA